VRTIRIEIYTGFSLLLLRKAMLYSRVPNFVTLENSTFLNRFRRFYFKTKRMASRLFHRGRCLSALWNEITFSHLMKFMILKYICILCYFSLRMLFDVIICFYYCNFLLSCLIHRSLH